MGVGEVVTVNAVTLDGRSLPEELEHHLVFLANGLMIGRASYSGSILHGASIEWIPDQPGGFFYRSTARAGVDGGFLNL